MRFFGQMGSPCDGDGIQVPKFGAMNSIARFGDSPHIESLNLAQAASSVSRESLALCVAGLGFGQKLPDTDRRAVPDVGFDVFPRKAEARTDRRRGIFRVHRRPQFTDRHQPLEQIEVRHVTSWKLAKPCGVSELRPVRLVHMTIERDPRYGSPEGPAPRTVGAPVGLRLANESFVH